MANNKKIESLGVSHLATFINKNDYLQTYLDQNDKTPSWDGTIHVLKNPTDRKEDIIGVVPVQVKSTQKSEIPLNNFRLTLSDLELYLRTGGVVLFVVSLDNSYELKGIYYKSLPPLTIKRLLKNSKSKKSKIKEQINKTVLVNIHPLPAEKVYAELLDFIRTSDRQRSFINKKLVSLSELPKNKVIKFYHQGKNPVDIFNYQEEHDIFPYLEDAENGAIIPVDSTIKVVEIFEETDLIFTIGETFIFDDIKRHRFPDGRVELRIGSGFTFSAHKKTNKFSLNFSRPDNLSEAIRCTEALQELQKAGYITLNGERVEFDANNLNEIKLMNLNEHLEELQRIATIMDNIGIKKELDLALFDSQSQKNLSFLNKGLILRETLALNYDESKLLHLKIANIHIITLYEFEDNKKGTMIDIFNETPWCRRGEDDDYSDISIFEVFEPNEWLKIDNCNFDSVIASYQRLVDNGLKHEGADNTIIKIIVAADMAKDTERRETLLNWAQRLSDWNLNYFKNSEIAIINDLQIKYRNRELNNTETETLSNILINNYGENEICFGVSVLLKSKPQADSYWNKLDEETKERYLDYPIYNLFQKL